MMRYCGISSLYWQCWNCGEYNHPMIEDQCRHCNAPEHATVWQFIKSLFGIVSVFNKEVRK